MHAGGRPPFGDRKVPESPGDTYLGCLIVSGLLVLGSLALFLLDVRI